MILGSLGAQLGTVDAQLGALVFGPPIVVAHDEEVIIITVEADDRLIAVPFAERTITVEADDRVIAVPDIRGVQ